MYRSLIEYVQQTRRKLALLFVSQFGFHAIVIDIFYFASGLLKKTIQDLIGHKTPQL